MDNRPIGIFDSGIGGLTVAAAIRRHLPNESFVYFGDTAHLPYGDKSPELIRHYAAKIANFLMERSCKAVVIACNTASAHAHGIVESVCGPDIPVINVIDPVAQAIADTPALKGQRVGVIATKGTINARVYPRRITRLTKDVKVVSLATPLLAPMIEEGFFSNTISKTIIHAYLSKSVLKNISALVLGCTHYPLIRKEVNSYYGKSVTIFDSTDLVARALSNELGRRNLMTSDDLPAEFHFLVSDKTLAFERSTKLFFKEKIALVEAPITVSENT